MAKNSQETRIEQLYDGVPAEQVEQLRAFRRRFPYQLKDIDGVAWRFIDSGSGERAVFVLAGGTTVAETSYQTLKRLAQHFRVIAPDYPPLGDLDALFRGAIRLIDYLGVSEIALLGGSYGGWMAQSFARHCPERVDRLAIAASGPPDPANSRQIAKLLPLLRLMPTFLLRRMMLRTFAGLASGSDLGLALMHAHLKEVVSYRAQRADFLTALQRLVNQTAGPPFSPDDLRGWRGRILLLFGSEDPATPPEKRTAMQALYPQAEMHVVEGAGHAMAITHQEEYFHTLEAFLDRE